MGLSHLQADYPCSDYGVKKCPKCRLRLWCFTIKEYALNAASAPSESSIPAVLVSLFGEYQPRTQTVTEHLADGSTVEYTQIVDGVAGIDWTWIASVALFAMFLYCLLRMIGGCLRWI